MRLQSSVSEVFLMSYFEILDTWELNKGLTPTSEKCFAFGTYVHWSAVDSQHINMSECKQIMCLCSFEVSG